MQNSYVLHAFCTSALGNANPRHFFETRVSGLAAVKTRVTRVTRFWTVLQILHDEHYYCTISCDKNNVVVCRYKWTVLQQSRICIKRKLWENRDRSGFI